MPFMAFRKLGEMVLSLGVGEKIFMVKPPLARRAYLVGDRPEIAFGPGYDHHVGTRRRICPGKGRTNPP